jgi:aspartate-semialdehyde dehydrogenase
MVGAQHWNVAVVGATGAVGQVLLRILEERKFPVGWLRPLASRRSAGSRVSFRGESLPVETLARGAFAGADLVFFAATGTLSQRWAPEAVAAGARVVDKSSCWRMDPSVPLVVPEINAGALERHAGIIASPNCTTAGVVMALEPLRRVAGLRRVVITTLQAVSGAGQAGTDELAEQLVASARGEVVAPRTFAAPIAHNVVPLCDDLGPDGSRGEERKLRDESRKILAEPDLALSATCLRVPVPVGHGASVWLQTEGPLSVAEARRALDDFPGVRCISDQEPLPTPQTVAGRDEVQVGRLRADPDGRGLWLWQVADNLRKGAATNAVQIAEALWVRRAV